MTIRIAALLALITASIPANAACDQEVATQMAKEVTREIGIMINFTKAACYPTRDGEKCSLLCVSDLNITGMNRDIVLTFITASAGKKMRDLGVSKFSNIVFSDRSLLLERRAMKISASKASALQAAFASSSESPAVMATRVGKEYMEFAMSKR